MNEDQLKKYKDQLEEERARINTEVAQEESPVDFGSDIDHGDEDSDRSEQVGNQLAVAQDLKNRRDEIDAAREKIKLGTYGKCEACGNPIEHEILSIDPESRLCEKCKSLK